MAGTDPLWRGLTLLILLVTLSISAYHRRRADRERGEVPRSVDPLAFQLLIGGLMLGALALLLTYLVAPRWIPWALVELAPWLRWVGVAGAVVDAALLWWTLATLGANITATHRTREAHELVTEGPYRYVRHPLYTLGSLLWLLVFLVSGLWPLLVLLAGTWGMLLRRTPLEEAALRERFGEAYERYEARTGRFLPRLR